MIKQLKESGKFKMILFLGGMSVFCFLLSLFRCWFTQTTTFLFLNWNLFLACIPWVAGTVMTVSDYRKNFFSLFILASLWLLFFPNSPYVLTDLLHLKLKTSVPAWFDLILILSFAWKALSFGFLSLLDIELFLKKYFRLPVVRLIIVFMLFLASFGVYLGRYMRWNSWDVLRDTSSVFADITNRFIHPFAHPRTWGLTVLMGVLLNMMFWTFKSFRLNPRPGLPPVKSIPS